MAKLTQLPNKMEIICTLKSKDLAQKVSMNGDEYISGSVIITSKIGNVTHDFLVKIFYYEYSTFSKNFQRNTNCFQ